MVQKGSREARSLPIFIHESALARSHASLFDLKQYIMPIKENAKKYMRVAARKTAQNRIIKGVLKSAIKKTREAVSAGNVDEAQTMLKKAQKAFDKASQKKVIKKNTAARKKSRLNALVKKVATKK